MFSLDIPIAPQHAVDSLMGSTLVLDDLTTREKHAIPITSAMPPLVGSPHIQVNNSTSEIAPSFGSSSNFSHDNLMSGVLYPSKPKWQVIESASL